MAKATKICRVCGKTYEACRTAKNIPGVFRWQDVACSPECGSIYLAKIEASRSGVTSEKVADAVEKRQDNVKFVDDDIDYEAIENELDDYFD